MQTARTSTGSARTTAPPAPGPVVPAWMQDAIFYQVFPDRFANGDLGNDPNGTLPWGSVPTNDAMLGGDLDGVVARLPYLQALGVNAIYTNPVFGSGSNHRYDTTDYEHVDPRLGGDAALHRMVDGAHASGMHVILDGVFNHTSHQHSWFADVRERGRQSPWWDFYTVRNWPIRYTRDAAGVLRSDDYASWWGYATLPELRTDNPAVRNYFLTGRDAIIKRWVRDFHVDGWRMDVADEIEPDYWRVARRELKATNPDAVLIAENWHDASSMLHGDQFDGVMNYQYFRQPAVDFFAHKAISPDEFAARLRTPYGGDARFGMLNLLDSHDTPRFITEAGGDWYRLRPAAIFQMTYVGAPMIYYGDEIGMEGGNDPDCRRAFPWQAVPPGTPGRVRCAGRAAVRDAKSGAMAPVPQAATSRQLLSLYRTLTATRTAEPALRRGEFAVLATHNDDHTIAYRRWISGQARDAVVALNDDVVRHEIHVPMTGVAPDGTAYVDALGGARYVVANGVIDLPAVDGNYGAVLLRQGTR